MANIRKRGSFWSVQIIRKGYDPIYRTFDTKRDAKAWSKTVESKMIRRVYRDNREAYEMTLDAALERYETSITPRKKGARQERDRISAWRQHPLASKSLGELSPSDFSGYRDQMRKAGKAENTIRLNLALISNVFTVARKEWELADLVNPIDNITKPKGSEKRNRRVSDAELRYLLKADNSKNRMLSIVLQLAIETAMRRSEIVETLDWANIDLDLRVAHLPDTKGGGHRDVPLSSQAIGLLRGVPLPHKGRVFQIRYGTDSHGRRKRVSGINADGVTAAFGRVRMLARALYEAECRKKGEEPEDSFLNEVRFHDSRHEATSSLFEKGFNVMEAAAVTGHRDLKTLQRYTHLSASKLAERLDAREVESDEASERVHPGMKLHEYVATPAQFTAAAKKLGISKRELQELIAGRARIDPGLALKLEALGPRAEMWLEMQAAYDLAQIRARRQAHSKTRKPSKSVAGAAGQVAS